MSEINLNVNNNSIPLTQQPDKTDAPTDIKSTTTTLPQTKDSVKTADQLESAVNLSAYLANTSRPVLAKPTEGNAKTMTEASVKKGDTARTEGKKSDVTARDVEGEVAAGTLSAGENVPVDQTQAEQPLLAPEEKKKKDDDGNSKDQGSGGGNQGDSQQGKAESFATASLSDLVAQLSAMQDAGEAITFDSDQINDLLNNFGKNIQEKMATDAVKGQSKVTEAKVAETNEPYPEFKIEGDTVIGPNGPMTIPGPKSPPQSASDVLVNSYHQLKETVNITQQMVINIPESPEKLSLVNFLKTLVDALTKFQEFLYTMNSMDSKSIREKSKAQLETSLHKLEEQRKKQEEQERKAREAGKKGGLLGVFQQVFNVVSIIMSVVLVVALAWTGPLAILAGAFMIASIASMIASQATGKGLFERAFQALGEMTSAIFDAMGIHGEANEWMSLVTKIILVILVCAVVVASNPMMFMFGGVSNVVGFLQDSGIVNQFVEKCGGDEKAQMIASIAVSAAIMMTTMVISIAMMFIPGGQGAILGQISSAVTNVTRVVSTTIMTVLQTTLRVSAQVAETVTKVIMQILKFIVNPGFWMTVTMLGMETAKTVNTVKMNYLLADLARMQGEMTKMIEQADALLTLLKKVIQRLLDSLSDTGAFIAQTSEILKKNFQGMSESMTNLWSA